MNDKQRQHCEKLLIVLECTLGDLESMRDDANKRNNPIAEKFESVINSLQSAFDDLENAIAE